MNISKIDDKNFREEAIKSFHWNDSNRRYEIHFTDLINCLLCSFKRKVLPNGTEDTEESYGQILTFVRGLGFDNLITDRFAGKKTVWIDGMQGNIDMIFQDIPYELTSSIYVGKSVKESDDLNGKYQYKIDQLRFYMASLPSTVGRLKIIEVAGRPPTEHTWQISMEPIDLARMRIMIISRKDVLLRALVTGDLSTIQKLRDIYAPILKSSRCTDETGYCKEWHDLKGIEPARKKWLTEMYSRYDRTAPILHDLRRLAHSS